MRAWRATSHGLRRGSENTMAPSVIRLVRTAAAPSTVHGSNVSIGPTLMPSQAMKASQPASSAATAISMFWAADPHDAVTPNFMGSDATPDLRQRVRPTVSATATSHGVATRPSIRDDAAVSMT